MAIANLASGQTAISFGAQGPNWATVSACATAGHAIGEASETIIRGDADMMVAGGSEAPVFEPLVGAFAAMRALSTRNDDPAGREPAVRRGPRRLRHRRGRRRARARGAEPRTPARRPDPGRAASATAPPPTRTTSRCLRRAARAESAPPGVALAKARHAARRRSTSSVPTRRRTPEGDPAELEAFRTIFGEHAPQGLDHGHQGRDRPHAGCRGRYRRDRHDLSDARRLRAAHAEPGRSGAADRRSRLHATQVALARHARRAGQCLWLRWPELGAAHPALGRVVSDQRPRESAAPELVELIDRLEKLLERLRAVRDRGRSRRDRPRAAQAERPRVPTAGGRQRPRHSAAAGAAAQAARRRRPRARSRPARSTPCSPL